MQSIEFDTNQIKTEGKRKRSTAPLRQRFLSLTGMARLFWLEAVLPLGIIAGMLCVMGNVQYQIHKAAHGRPKHIGNDEWDVALERRDKKITGNYYSAAGN